MGIVITESSVTDNTTTTMNLKNNSILFQKRAFGFGTTKSYLFLDPCEIISCQKLESIDNCLKKIEEKIKEGFWVAGYISYEAGVFINGIKPSKIDVSNIPLLWFGVYRKVSSKLSPVKTVSENCSCNNAEIIKINFDTTLDEYTKKITQIKKLIENGKTYQVNFTFKCQFKYITEPVELYYNLVQRQSVSYGAFLNSPDFSILSLSPELFFKRNKNKITMRPMKGTSQRGMDNEGDMVAADELKNCPKNRAENIMIVDMVRNDLSKICRKQSVKTTELFNVEKYETLFQMTSSVEGYLKNKCGINEIFRALFPSGSVTGAPKIATMQAIDKLEKTPRGVYTGAIGYFAPNGRAEFNVAIRTLVLDNKNKTGVMGIGSGITYISDAILEYQECLLKSKFLTTPKPNFQLIETILLNNGKYLWLSEHLKRMSGSAKYFGIVFNLESIKTELKKLCYKNKVGRFKVRIELFKNGKICINTEEIRPQTLQLEKAVISKVKVNSTDVFLYHKTSQRKIYNTEHERMRKKGFLDVIFENEKGQITEGAITNVVIKKDNKYFTPTRTCGLLNGICRQSLLNEKICPKEFFLQNNGAISSKVFEKVITKAQLLNADKVFLVNSLRGIIEVNVFNS